MFEAPFTMVVAGPTSSGKTYWVKELIENAARCVSPPPEEIVYCYSIYQALFNQMTRYVTFHEGLPSTDAFTDCKRRLVIIDDLMSEADERVRDLFTKGSHHLNLSVIFIVQNLFSKNKEMRTISLNSHYLVMFKAPRDVGQIATLGKQMGRIKAVVEAYHDSTSRRHGYLLLDFKQSTPDDQRLKTDVFSNSPIVYVPKK